MDVNRHTHRSCRWGVCTKLPPVISLNPDLTKDLKTEEKWVGTCAWRPGEQAGVALTETARRKGRRAARSGHPRTGHYPWCKCIQRGIWAASPSVRQSAPNWQRRPKPAASSLSIPAVPTRPASNLRAKTCQAVLRSSFSPPFFGLQYLKLWCRLESMPLVSCEEGTSPTDLFCRGQDY